MLTENLNDQYLAWLSQHPSKSEYAQKWIKNDFNESNRSLIFDIVYDKFKIIQFLAQNGFHVGFYMIVNDDFELTIAHEMCDNTGEQLFNFSTNDYHIEFLIYLCGLYSESDSNIEFAMKQFMKGKIFNDIEMDFIRTKMSEISSFSIEHGFLKIKSYNDIINPYISMISTSGKTIKFKPHKVDLSNDGLNSVWRTNSGTHIQLFEIFDMLSTENLNVSNPVTT